MNTDHNQEPLDDDKMDWLPIYLANYVMDITPEEMEKKYELLMQRLRSGKKDSDIFVLSE